MKRNSALFAITFLIIVPFVCVSFGQDWDWSRTVQRAVVVDSVWFNRVDSTLRDYERTDHQFKSRRNTYRLLTLYPGDDTCFTRWREYVDVNKALFVEASFEGYIEGETQYLILFKGRKYIMEKYQSHNIVKPIKRYIAVTPPTLSSRLDYDWHPVCIVQDSIGRMSILSDTTDMYIRLIE